MGSFARRTIELETPQLCQILYRHFTLESTVSNSSDGNCAVEDRKSNSFDGTPRSRPECPIRQMETPSWSPSVKFAWLGARHDSKSVMACVLARASKYLARTRVTFVGTCKRASSVRTPTAATFI